MSEQKKLPNRNRMAELLRESLDVELPADLAARVVEGRAAPSRTPVWRVGVAAAATIVALTLWLTPARHETGRSQAPPTTQTPIVLTLGPAASSDGTQRITYTVHADGRVADTGQLPLTSYALDTLSEENLLEEAF